MTEDTFLAGNERISQFMERSHVLNYHESWSMLIPVIEKLTREKFRAVLYFNPDAGSTTLYDPMNHRFEVSLNGPKEKSIMTAWQCVVTFLGQLEKNG